MQQDCVINFRTNYQQKLVVILGVMSLHVKFKLSNLHLHNALYITIIFFRSFIDCIAVALTTKTKNSDHIAVQSFEKLTQIKQVYG